MADDLGRLELRARATFRITHAFSLARLEPGLLICDHVSAYPVPPSADRRRLGEHLGPWPGISALGSLSMNPSPGGSMEIADQRPRASIRPARGLVDIRYAGSPPSQERLDLGPLGAGGPLRPQEALANCLGIGAQLTGDGST
jgi:hypothetical protein